MPLNLNSKLICLANMKSVLQIISMVLILVSPAQAKNDLLESPGKSAIVIFSGQNDSHSSSHIKINKVLLVQETSYSLILDVFYSYQNTIPAEQIKLFVLPDMPYWASNAAVVETGHHKTRISIDLYQQKMQEDHVEEYESSKLTLSFDHYAPEKFNGAIHTEIIPFKKIWKDSQLIKSAD